MPTVAQFSKMSRRFKSKLRARARRRRIGRQPTLTDIAKAEIGSKMEVNISSRKPTNPKGVGVPNRMRMNLAYEDKYLVNPGTGPNKSYNLVVNGPYDPDAVFLSGTSSALWGKFMQIYQRARVLGLRYKVTIMNYASTPAQVYCAYLGRDTTDISAPTYMKTALPRCQTKLIDTNGSGEGSRAVFKGYLDFVKLEGLQVINSVNYYSTASTIPAVPLYMQIGASQINAAVNAAYNILIEYVYEVEFFDPVDTVITV